MKSMRNARVHTHDHLEVDAIRFERAPPPLFLHWDPGVADQPSPQWHHLC